MLRLNLREVALDHNGGAYLDFTCVDCEAYTVDDNSRFLVLIK